ncbi:small kinetochore-associated protein [Cololabis saira]|uniref:small kinetochore-associated protein n=1 Tax=Cololabis saira TaxID=129043 RepID=UPI002AD346D8|nr:small kinetochore-associated protein [Cololabis saira]XP_061563272.1 small kinetochore-associated protein [Cololabis saira]XP_061563273.1 small kinetochore-associated protein [Cololabis saira]
MSSKIPRGVHLPGETKKTGQKVDSKDTAAVPKLDGNLKVQKENLSRKNLAPKVHKGISTRSGQQAELKEQNQHLMIVNEELQKNLSETLQRAVELELQLSDLDKEKAQVQKNLQDCHILLFSAKIDPVLGEKVGEAAQHNEDKRKEVVNVSTDLLSELKAFGGIASEQRAQLQEIRTTMMDLTKARELMKQEKENFSQQAEEMEKALKDAEMLLL